ncbi:MAG: hypothetical protein A2001_01450 [Treponema sp. GWC1_61_84]|nr:MAG: hypothetical protein A2001_01450 [Treponema sp. GWC1_61_84]
MKYLVIRGFKDISGWKNPGDEVEAAENRARLLSQSRLIGARIDEAVPAEASVVEAAVAAPKESTTVVHAETAVKKNAQERRG